MPVVEGVIAAGQGDGDYDTIEATQANFHTYLVRHNTEPPY